jgi:tetratricopeptide (TPR) repeat protein
VADFLAYTLADYTSALRLSETAIALNPLWPELWNTRGDCLYSLKRCDEAQAAFERALDLNPDSVRARYNLSFTLCEGHNLLEALRVIGEALFLDKTGRFSERLLRQQAEIVRRVTQAEQERKRCRIDRFPAGGIASLTAVVVATSPYPEKPPDES